MADSRPSLPPPAGDTRAITACPTCLAVFRGGFQRCPNDGALLEYRTDDPLVGTVVAERYQIEALLGEGGIGRVYRARHTRMSRRFALKVPFGELAYDRKLRQRFHNEAEAASRLSHPNVIGVVDVGETATGLFYLAMDLAEGTALCDAIGNWPMTEARALTIFAQIADGLAHAHERGLVHRDLKPENVILGRGPDGSEQARIVDFGLAIVEEERSSNRLTTEGVVLGTPQYMAPEQATDEAIDFRADLFSLGLMLFEMVAGCLPFDGTAVEVARQNLGRELPTVHQRTGREVDPLIERLIHWLTRKHPRDRPDRTAQVAELARMLLRGDREAAAACLPETDASPLARSRAGDRAPTLPSEALPLPAPAPREAEDHRPAGSRARRGALIGVAVALLLGTVAVVTFVGRDGGGGGGAPASVVDAALAPVAVLELDAGVIDASEPVDAAVAEAPVDAAAARPAVVRTAPTPVRPRAVDAGVEAPGAGTGTGTGASAPEPITTDSLKQLYAGVGTRLDAATRAHGLDATAPLRKRYAAIPYLDAIRKPALRAEAQAELRAIARELERLR